MVNSMPNYQFPQRQITEYKMKLDSVLKGANEENVQFMRGEAKVIVQ